MDLNKLSYLKLKFNTEKCNVLDPKTFKFNLFPTGKSKSK